MIKVYIISVQDKGQKNADPVFAGSLGAIQSGEIEDYINEPEESYGPFINMFIPDSKLERLKNYMTGKGTNVCINLLSYSAKDAIVPRSSVEAVGKLTNKQMKILSELLTGASDLEIAERHFIELSTVKTHISNIYQTLNVSNRCQAICAYLRYMLEYEEYMISQSLSLLVP
jgi:DNA-binding CsgD family transcriptional regulator